MKSNIFSILSQWIRSFLGDNYNHYMTYLPKKIGILSDWFLRALFRGIQTDKGQGEILKGLSRDGIVVYITKYKTDFEYLFYHARYAEEGLPTPEIGFGHRIFLWQPVSRLVKILVSKIDYFFNNFTWPDKYRSGYIRDELVNGRAGFLSLIDKKGFYKRFVEEGTDPLSFLIELQRSQDKPIFLVPQLMFFSTSPPKDKPSLVDIIFGTIERPGRLRRLYTLFRVTDSLFAEVSEAMNLKSYLEYSENRDKSVEDITRSLRKQLLTQLNRHRQSITGPVLKNRLELKHNILMGEKLQKYMTDYAEEESLPISAVHKKADAYITEIAADYKPSVIALFSLTLSMIFKAMFDGVNLNTEMLGKIKAMGTKGPVIYVPCHKSHIDYLILSHLLNMHNMACPHIAAGKNLSFWPMGPILRGGGAFFLRRTFKGKDLYREVFTQYIHKLLEEGFPMEFFIEGGRSRTGKLLRPSMGILSFLMQGFEEGVCEDLIFVPVYIGYDKVLEESSYLHELEGGKKEPENFTQVIKAGRFLKKRYGKIYIRFHEPLSFKAFKENYKSQTEMKSETPGALRRNLAYRLLNSIDHVSVVTPHGLVAAALLNIQKKGFTFNEILYLVETYLGYLQAQGATIADTLTADRKRAARQVFDSYVGLKYVENILTDVEHQEDESEFSLVDTKRPALDYYKNNCISYFVGTSFTALSILERDAFQFSTNELQTSYSFLRDFFKNEFSYDLDRTPEYFVRKSIKFFIDENILAPHPTLPDTYNLTATGFRALKLYAGFLTTYFESYLIALNHFKRCPPKEIDAKERLKKAQAMGLRMYKRNLIGRREALSKVNYKNAIDLFLSLGISCTDDSDKIDYYTERIESYLKCL